jgi:hypothetical protein
MTPPASPARARPAAPDAKLRTVDASMIHGLPDPSSPESLDWIREALAALREGQGGPDMAWLSDVIAEMQRRLDALEARPVPDPVDLSDILRRLAELEARPIAIEAPPAVAMDPLDPLSWVNLEDAKAALMVLITKEAARRVGHSVELYEDMVALDAKGADRTRDEELRLLQHQGWAKERSLVELARLTHNAAIRGLSVLSDARSYDWRIGWPLVAAPVEGDAHAGSDDPPPAADGV